MYTKVEKLNLLVRGIALLLLSLMMFLFVRQLGKQQSTSANDLTIIVEKPYQQLIEKELNAFKLELPDNCKIGIHVTSKDRALDIFTKNSKTMVVSSRKILPDEQSHFGSNRLPLKQDLLATGMVNSPIKELYLVQDGNVEDLERKFSHFLFSARGQDIILKEGYVSARKGFSQQ